MILAHQINLAAFSEKLTCIIQKIDIVLLGLLGFYFLSAHITLYGRNY